MNIKEIVIVALLILPNIAFADRRERPWGERPRFERSHPKFGGRDFYHVERYDRFDRPVHSYDGYFPRPRSPQNNWNARPQYFDRQYSDNSPVRNGFERGELSVREMHELREQRNELRDTRHAFLSDGWLSRREKDELRKEKEAFRKKLEHELNDGERRYR